MSDIAERFKKIRPNYLRSGPALHRPLLALIALGECYKQTDRLKPFIFYHNKLLDLFDKYYQQGLEYKNTHHPFGKLENSGIWEIYNHGYDIPRDTKSGHLKFDYLINNDVKGGLTNDAYGELVNNRSLLLQICWHFLESFIPKEKHKDLLLDIGIPLDSNVFSNDAEKNKPLDANNKHSNNENTMNHNPIGLTNSDFVAYINSLHNIHASGANALAESQALNQYFSDLYEPFPVVDQIVSLLKDSKDQVVLLTGHAGDGKSTIAFDTLKKISGMESSQPLHNQPKELECIEPNTQSKNRVHIVKDMSELSIEKRAMWLKEAFDQQGSWLIVSNTGPLLNTFRQFAESHGLSPETTEQRILDVLHSHYSIEDLSKHKLDFFPKPLFVLNIARFDNIRLGAKILKNLVEHGQWKNCDKCINCDACPIYINRNALLDAINTVHERVTWIYRKITEYEQRTTLREITAHIAYSVTGGLSCNDINNSLAANNHTQNQSTINLLKKIIFSEKFFGYTNGSTDHRSLDLHATSLIHNENFGGPVSTDQEKTLTSAGLYGWSTVPDLLKPLIADWTKNASSLEGSSPRFALRRLLYIFGRDDSSHPSCRLFLDSFLQSPRLIDFDGWITYGSLNLSRSQNKRLKNSCLRVLLETYSGFSSGQFSGEHDRLYLTLRRPDKSVVQPTQFVTAELAFDSFSLVYDTKHNVPALIHEPSNVTLPLKLPLLDYIEKRNHGILGSELSQIHLSKLEWFRAELMRHNEAPEEDEIKLLKSDIDGHVYLHRYHINKKNNVLEVEQ
ncbi:hypothetical protein LRD18_09010 [Halorhodospira halochloris]|uniref:hypothetical protein n=1 Tax=Halorhodospira halochloris TaxID=1052 RepID=UPI001EE8AAFE|nr:hypothetical protein [Halorhodospira halochloris]MCG5531010.1 hypothetical protein [Halorhodospira halochloris]